MGFMVLANYIWDEISISWEARKEYRGERLGGDSIGIDTKAKLYLLLLSFSGGLKRSSSMKREKKVKMGDLLSPPEQRNYAEQGALLQSHLGLYIRLPV